jgi:hypothetical protein
MGTNTSAIVPIPNGRRPYTGSIKHSDNFKSSSLKEAPFHTTFLCEGGALLLNLGSPCEARPKLTYVFRILLHVGVRQADLSETLWSSLLPSLCEGTSAIPSVGGPGEGDQLYRDIGFDGPECNRFELFV